VVVLFVRTVKHASRSKRAVVLFVRTVKHVSRSMPPLLVVHSELEMAGVVRSEMVVVVLAEKPAFLPAFFKI
jgi:hypothetical protein